MIEAGWTDPGTLQRLAVNGAVTKTQLDRVLQQQSTGKVADSFAGLGASLRSSLDLRPALQHTQTWQDNVDRATGRLDAAQAALTRIAAIAQDFYARTIDIN